MIWRWGGRGGVALFCSIDQLMIDRMHVCMRTQPPHCRDQDGYVICNLPRLPDSLLATTVCSRLWFSETQRATVQVAYILCHHSNVFRSRISTPTRTSLNKNSSGMFISSNQSFCCSVQTVVVSSLFYFLSSQWSRSTTTGNHQTFIIDWFWLEPMKSALANAVPSDCEERKSERDRKLWIGSLRCPVLE